MLVTKRVFNFRLALERVAQLRLSDFTNALNNYVNEKLSNMGLYSKAVKVAVFNENTVNGRGFHRAGISKIRGYIAKFLVKSAPYLGNTNTEFIKASTNSSDVFMEINVDTEYQTLKVNPEIWRRFIGTAPPIIKTLNSWAAQNNNIGRYLEKDSSLGTALHRYVRYLNYQFRKYKVPMLATIQLKTSFINSEVTNMIVASGTSISEMNPKVSACYVITLGHTRWMRIGSDSGQYETHTVEEYSKLPDRYFSEGMWYNISDANLADAHRDCRVYAPDAHIFKFLENGLNILNSLSRKTSYDISTYTFRVAENS